MYRGLDNAFFVSLLWETQFLRADLIEVFKNQDIVEN